MNIKRKIRRGINQNVLLHVNNVSTSEIIGHVAKIQFYIIARTCSRPIPGQGECIIPSGGKQTK